MLEKLGKRLGLSKPPVPFDDWLDQVAGPNADEELYPVKQLYVFFKNAFRPAACGQVVLGTDVARAHSRTLRDMGALGDETLNAYVNYWKKIRYLRQ